LSDIDTDEELNDETIAFSIAPFQLYIGMAIAFGSGILLFLWGWYFSLFDSDIDWRGKPLETLGFFVWPIFGAYGVGFMFARTKGGIWIAGLALAVFTLAAAAGQVRQAVS
jgi:hypothetical protein